jgi:hypothetical protein
VLKDEEKVEVNYMLLHMELELLTLYILVDSILMCHCLLDDMCVLCDGQVIKDTLCSIQTRSVS